MLLLTAENPMVRGQVAATRGRVHARGMGDDSDRRLPDEPIAILKAAYFRDGADGAVEAAKHMISAATAFLTFQYGPDEARRILEVVGAAQGKAS